jgi:hypothetical protein
MKRSMLIAIFTGQALASFAWGSEGHKTIAQIAEMVTQKAIKDSVKCYLGSMSFEEASVWMDEIRDDHSFDYLKPAHYINIAKDKTYVKAKGINIMNELDLIFLALQKKETKESVNFALKKLFHLIGDLHQPLHTGYESDKGGNTVIIEFKGKKGNLHKLWDSELIESYHDQIFHFSNIETMSEIKELQKEEINSIKWLEESRSFLQDVYDFPKNGQISKEYIEAAHLVIKNRLTKAGIRLSNVLNKYFSK